MTDETLYHISGRFTLANKACDCSLRRVQTLPMAGPIPGQESTDFRPSPMNPSAWLTVPDQVQCCLAALASLPGIPTTPELEPLTQHASNTKKELPPHPLVEFKVGVHRVIGFCHSILRPGLGLLATVVCSVCPFWNCLVVFAVLQDPDQDPTTENKQHGEQAGEHLPWNARQYPLPCREKYPLKNCRLLHMQSPRGRSQVLLKESGVLRLLSRRGQLVSAREDVLTFIHGCPVSIGRAYNLIA
ncbi:hypothetical protein ACRALDRAFT_213463 [Sodiomyces alcalophilus JCM 7366]|uniref:uncharacterized protein n=1 Tax=Sodiomyces alcalophilus JCM 7366 TaxID=591952 RepID=UPI0039B44EAC